MANVDVVRGFLAVLSSSAGALLVSAITTPILVRFLGPSGYGTFAFMVAVFGVASMITAPGISTGVRKYIAESRDEEHWAGYVFGFYFRIGLLFVAAVMATIALAAYTGLLRVASVPAGYELYFYLVVAWLLFAQLFSLGKNTLRGFGQEHYSDPLLVLQNLLFGVVGISLVYFGFGVAGALIGKVVAVLVVTVLAFAIVARSLPLSFTVRRTPREFPGRELLTFNVLNIVLLFLVTSLYQVDILLLGTLAGSTETGFYRAALTIAEFVWFVPFALQTVLLHSTSELWTGGERQRVTELATRSTRYCLLFTSLLAIGLLALGDRFVPLYFGAEFQSAVVPLFLLLPGALGFAVARPILAIGQGTGSLRPLIYATGGAAAVNLVLNLALIPGFGMAGAAVATSTGYGLMFVFHVASARRIGFDPLADLRLLRVAFTVAVSAPVIVGMGRVIPSDVVALSVVPPVGFTVLWGVAFATGAIDGTELSEFVEELPEPIATVLTSLGELVGVGDPA